MLEHLRAQVCEANLALVKHGLVIFSWGNVSAMDQESRLVVIKPSGVSYDGMVPEQMVIVDLEGHVVEGELNPSSDTATHLEIYKAMPVGSVVHTHSQWGTTFAQAGRDIPAFGTTHADYFYGAIPCTRQLTAEEITGAYEKNTGLVIAETFAGQNPCEIPGVLVHGHGCFTWGKDGEEAVHNAVVLEYLAQMAYHNLQLNPQAPAIPQVLLDKHFLRKHGANAYYGQEAKK